MYRQLQPSRRSPYRQQPRQYYTQRPRQNNTLQPQQSYTQQPSTNPLPMISQIASPVNTMQQKTTLLNNPMVQAFLPMVLGGGNTSAQPTTNQQNI